MYEKYIFLVGTHKNPDNGKVVTDDDLKKFSSELQEYLFSHYCHFQNAIHFFSQTGLIMTGLENSMDQTNSGIKVITKELDEFSKYLPFFSEAYPTSWLCFKAKLLNRKKLAGSLLLKLPEAEKIANDSGVMGQEVLTALVLLHDIGLIIYPGKCLYIYIFLFTHHMFNLLACLKVYFWKSKKKIL